MKAHLITEKLEYCRQVSSDKWIARCPAHDDRSPSLSVKAISNDRTLIHCHAGCGANDILDALGLDYSALYPDEGENYPPAQNRRQKAAEKEITVAILLGEYMKQGKRLTESEKQLVIKARLAG